MPAFPTAQGFGVNSIGGRGGTLYRVTNLNDSGPGSLRAAVEASGARIVVFNVSGTITLQSDLTILNPYITIAGQTSPGGIQVRNHQFLVRAHNVIIRHMRFRMGNVLQFDDSLTVWGISSGSPTYNVIIDHCDMMYATNENLDLWNFCTNITIQWCVVARPATVDVGGENHNFLVGRGEGGETYVKQASIHHNLFADGASRLPLMQDYNNGYLGSNAAQIDFRNNLIYNGLGNNNLSDARTAFLTLSEFNAYKATGNAHGIFNIVGNRWIHGPASDISVAEGFMITHFVRLYMSDNWGPKAAAPSNGFTGIVSFWDVGNQDGSSSGTYYGPGSFSPTNLPVSGFNAVANSAYAFPAVTTDPASNVRSVVLAGAGCRVPSIDSLTQSVLNDVINGTGTAGVSTFTYPTLTGGSPPADSDNDGIPDSWEIAHGLNPNNAADANQVAPNGYTWIENYLNELAGDADTTSPAAPTGLVIR